MRSLETEVALLKEGLQQNLLLVNKLDTTIDKIAGLGNDITKMLALHEQRLARLEDIDKELHTAIEARRNEATQEMKDIDLKLTVMIKEIGNDINKTEDRLLDAIKENRRDIDAAHDKRLAEIEELSKRITSLEKWRWMLLGGGAVAGMIFPKLSALVGMLM